MPAKHEIPLDRIALLRTKVVPEAVKEIMRMMPAQPDAQPWLNDDVLKLVDCYGNGACCWHAAKKSNTEQRCTGCQEANQIVHGNGLCPHLSVDSSRHVRCSA